MKSEIEWHYSENRLDNAKVGLKYLVCGYEIKKGKRITFMDIAYLDHANEWMLQSTREIIAWAELPKTPVS